MKAIATAALLALAAWALPAEAQDGTKFLALKWDLVEKVTLADSGDGVAITARGSSAGPVSASVEGPDGRVHALDLEIAGGAFVLEASAPGGPWSEDGLHTLAFEGQGARDEVPVEMAGGALAPGFGSASRSGDTVTFETWDMITRASVESRGGVDTVEVTAETRRTAPVTASLLSPDGSSSVLGVVEPARGGYSFSAAVGGQLWSQDGDYTLLLEQPGEPPYSDDLILPVSGGAVALPVEPYERDVLTSSAGWSEVERVFISAESMSVEGVSDRDLRVSMLSPDGVAVDLGTIEAGGQFYAEYDLSGSTGAAGPYVVQFGMPGDELIAYLGDGELEAVKWVMLDSAEALSGEPDVVELRGSTDRPAPVSAVLTKPDGQQARLPPAVPDGGMFSMSVPAAGWKDGLHSITLEQPGEPPYRDIFEVYAESGGILRTGHVGDVKASGARWSAVERVSVTQSGVSVEGSSESELGARLSAPDGSSVSLGAVPSERGAISLELDTSAEPWGRDGAYALILEGPGVRDVVPLIMRGGGAAPGFGEDGSLKAWEIIESTSVERRDGSDVLTVRGSAPGGGPVSVTLVPPGGQPAALDETGGEFSLEVEVGGSAWSRDGVYAVVFEQDDPPAADRIYLEVSGGSVVPEFGAAFAVLAAAAGAGLAARRIPRIQIRA